VRRASACIFVISLLFAATVPFTQARAAGTKVEMEQIDRVYLRFAGTTRALRQLIRCMVSRDEQAAREVFDHPQGSVAQAEAFNLFLGSAQATTCLRPSIRRLGARRLAALGTLAETLMDMDGVENPVAQLPSWQGAGGGAFVWTWQRLTDEQESLHVPVANCLVNAHPVRVAELLATDETSNRERKLFNSMSAEISDCIPAGQRLTLNPMMLRPALAVSFYISTRMPPPAS